MHNIRLPGRSAWHGACVVEVQMHSHRFATPIVPRKDETLMICPCPLWIKPGKKAFIVQNGPSTLTEIVL